MKQQANNGSFDHDSIKNKIMHTHEQNEESEKHRGAIHGAKNFPALTGGSLKSCIEPITRNMNVLGAEVHQLCQSSLHRAYGALKRTETLAENEVLDRDIAAKEKEHSLKSLELRGKFPLGALLRVLIGSILMLLLMSADATYLSYSLQVIMKSLFSAIALAVGIAISVAAAVEYGPSWIANIKSAFVRHVVSGTVIGLILALFIWLGFYRSQYIYETTHEVVSPYSFIIINAVLCLGIFLIGRFLVAGSMNELKTGLPVVQAQIKNFRLKKEVIRLKKKRAENNSVLADFLKEKMYIIGAYNDFKVLMQQLYLKIVSTYKEANILARPDKGIPDIFSEKEEELESFNDTDFTN